MHQRTSSRPVVLGSFLALGSGGCLLFTSLSGLDELPPEAVAISEDAAADAPTPDAPAPDAPAPDAPADGSADADGHAASAVEVVALGDPGVTGIAVHSDGLYYVQPQAQALYRVASADLGPTARGVPLIAGEGTLKDVVVTALDVFLSVDRPDNGCILRAKHDGSGVAVIQDYCTLKSHLVSSPGAVFGVGTDTGDVNGVWRVDVATAAVSQIFFGLRTNGGQILSGVAYGGTAIYVSDQDTSKITTLASTNSLNDFATDQAVVDMAADATTLYWITPSGAVRSLPTSEAGQTPRELAAVVAPRRIAVDDASLYVTTSGLAPSSGTLVRIAKDSGAKTELASGLANPSAITVDATYVYWANIDDGTIMRVARK